MSTLVLRIALVTIAVCALVFLAVSSYYYFKYQGIVDARLKEPLFANTAKIFAAPREVRPGQKLSVHLIANELREAGYTGDGASQTSQLGTFSEGVQTITVRPGPQSYHAQDPATIHISGGVVEFDQRRSRPAAVELRAGAAADHRPERRRQPHQAPPAHLRRDSAEPGAGGGRHRRPPLL